MNQAINQKIELGLVHYLKTKGSFKGVGIIAKYESNEAPNSLPCLMINCSNVSKSTEHPHDMHAKEANIICHLVVDSEQTSEKIYKEYAEKLSCLMEDLTSLQEVFNDPISGKDNRKVKGLHLHYIDEFQIDSEADGILWNFAVGCTFIIQA